MKTAVTSSGPTLDADVDPRFGRCAYFLIVETDTMVCEAVENTNAALGQGAGIQSAQLLAGKQVKSVLTGSCGPKAYDALSAAGVGVILGCSGVARQVLERFKGGQLNTASGPDVAGHAGMTGTPPSSEDQSAPTQQPPMPGGRTGRGPCGGGMGQGGGGGMGRGRGRGQGCGGGGGGGGAGGVGRRRGAGGQTR